MFQVSTNGVVDQYLTNGITIQLTLYKIKNNNKKVKKSCFPGIKICKSNKTKIMSIYI